MLFRTFFILFLFTSYCLNAQKCEEIVVTGSVMDTSLNQSYYNLIVVNKSTNKGDYGAINGSFSILAQPFDTLLFSIRGYPVQTRIVTNVDKCKQHFLIHLPAKVQLLDEVKIYPLKSLEDIQKEREELRLKEIRTVTGVNMLSSPITALYERFSKSSKHKKFIAEMQYKDKKQQILKELFRVYISYDVVELSEEHFEEFINYLDLNDHFLKTAKEYELVIYIKESLAAFKLDYPTYFEDK